MIPVPSKSELRESQERSTVTDLGLLSVTDEYTRHRVGIATSFSWGHWYLENIPY